MAREYPEAPRVGIGIVLLRGDEVLLVRRGRPPAEGQWSLPGGVQELGETAEACARRELFEETGLRTQLLPRPAAVAIRSFHPDWAPTAAFSYAAIVAESTPLVPESGQPAAWTRLDCDWASYFPADPLRIRHYAAHLSAGADTFRS